MLIAIDHSAYRFPIITLKANGFRHNKALNNPSSSTLTLSLYQWTDGSKG